jgi:hypothetical protein
MKNRQSLQLLLLLLPFYITSATAQKFPAIDKSIMDVAAFPTDYKISDKLVKVTYSRPLLNGRSLGELAPMERFGEQVLMKQLKLLIC